MPPKVLIASRQLQVACGVISIVFGVFLGYQIGFVDGMFSSHLH